MHRTLGKSCRIIHKTNQPSDTGTDRHTVDIGGAIRLGPNEVHVYDPKFYHQLYSLGSKYYKDPSMHKVLGAPTSTLAESDPIRHKRRRAPLEPLFAKKNILKLEPMLMEHVEYCCQRFDEYFAAGKPVSMEWALKSLAMGECYNEHHYTAWQAKVAV